jgi:uncharacterized membrane protein YkvA (DUF1232 family)
MPGAMARDPMTEQRSGAAPRQRRRGRSGTVRRLLAAVAFLPVAERAPLYARLLWSLLVDDRTPATRKALLAGAAGYVLLGRDIVPDRIPVLGSLDDVVVVALALDLFFAGIDETTLDEKLVEAGIARATYEEDVARVRRLLPAPLRRTIHRLPAALGTAGAAIRKSDIGPRLRATLSREGSIA